MLHFAQRSHRYFVPGHSFSWSRWTRPEPLHPSLFLHFGNLFMSLKCPIPYASQPGDPQPSGDNMQMNSNKQICVFCTIWPSDTYVVDLPCLGWGSALDDVSLLPGKDGCVGHITWVMVYCKVVYCKVHPGGSGCLGLSNLQIQALGSDPRDWSHSEDPLSSAGISWRLCLQVAERMPSHGPLIFILHQYLALGRWPLLTSGIQRRKNLIHVMCRPAPDCLRVIQDTFLIEHVLNGLPVLLHTNGLWKALGTYCQMAQRKVILIYSLGQLLMWVPTFPKPCQHWLLLYLKFLATCSADSESIWLSSHLSFFNYLEMENEIEKCHVINHL